MSASPYTRKSARSAAFFAIVFRVPGQIATLIGYVVLVRFLSESEFGVYSLFYATLPLVGTLISFGLENTLKRYQPEYLRKGENRLAHRLTRRIGQFRLVSTTIFLIVIVLFWTQIAPFFKIAEYRDQFLLFGLVIIAHFQCQVLVISLSAHLLQKFSVGITAVFSILKLVGYSLAAGLFGFDLWMAFIVDLIAYAVFYVGLKYAYLKKPDHSSGEQVSLPPQERKRLTRYAAYYSFNDAGTLTLDTRKESFFLAALLDTVSVGAFAFAERFNVMLGRISPIHLLDSVVQPLFVSLDYKQYPERIHKYFSLLINTALLVRLPTFVFTACYHAQIVEVLFGGRFMEYSYLLAVVAMFSMGTVIGPPVTLVAQMEEKAQFVLASKIFGVYGIAASLLLIPVIGVLGAAIASGTAILMKNLFIWWFVRKLARWRSAFTFITRAALIWGTFVALVVLQQRWLGGGSLLELASGLLVWCGFFLLQVRAAMGPEERQIVAGLFSGRELKLLRLFGVA